MSVIRCKQCGKNVDTDFEETWGEDGEVCENCIEEYEREEQANSDFDYDLNKNN